MAAPGDRDRALMLTPGHRDHLERGSGLSPETIARAGLYSVSAKAAAELLGYGVHCGGIAIPYDPVDASNPFTRIRLDCPAPTDEQRRMYRAPRGRGNRLYLRGVDTALLANREIPIIVTEGEKKTLAGNQHLGGLALVVGLSGVDSWRARDPDTEGSLPIRDLDAITWRGRTVYVVFDSDAATKRPVRLAEKRLAAELGRRGAHLVEAIRLPPGAHGEKVGLDDYFVAGHTPEQLFAEKRITLFKTMESEAVIVSAATIAPRTIAWLWPGRIAVGAMTTSSGCPTSASRSSSRTSSRGSPSARRCRPRRRPASMSPG